MARTRSPRVISDRRGGQVRGRLEPGSRTHEPLVVTVGALVKALPDVARRVADLPAESAGVVVWQQGSDELAVEVAATTLTCATGVVSVGIQVRCDELDGPQSITVPLAVGTASAPTGLVLSAFERVHGPALVADVWSDALTAYAVETVVELARTLCARVGVDASGRRLVPGSISAGPGRLVIQPMARFESRVLGTGAG